MSTSRVPPEGSLRQPTEELRAAVQSTIGEASQRIEQLRGQLADWQQRHAELLCERNALLQELARQDMLRGALQQAEAKSRELQLEQRSWQELEAALREQLTNLRERCQDLEEDLAKERDLRLQAQAKLRAAEEELTELLPLLEVLEAAEATE